MSNAVRFAIGHDARQMSTRSNFTKRWRYLLISVAALVAACGSARPSVSPVSRPPGPTSGLTAQSPAAASSPVLAASAAPLASPASATSAASASSPAPANWLPKVGDTFQVQYAGTVDVGIAASIYDLDVDDTPASIVAALHARGRHVLCYIDAGAWENYRSDAASFPAAVLGKTMGGWPDERWLDIRKIGVLAPLLRQRLATCAAKGFDGVDPDNVNGYMNATGFPLTAADQLAFDRWLGSEAHSRGLVVALKNDGDQAGALAGEFDAAVVEQCVEYDECDQYAPFIAAGKPVFDIEYSRAPGSFCPVAAKLHFSIIGKHLALDAYRTHC